jgi:Flp pilus assembly protein CpaB
VTTTASSPATSSSKLFLLVAIVLGILATILSFVFINSASLTNASGPKRTIVVAKHDLSPNAVLDPERDLEKEEIPAKFSSLAGRSLDSEALKSYKGERVNRDIFAGQPVLIADLAAVGQLVLEKPYYALTIPADANMIIPGDTVKIIFAKTPTASVTPGAIAANTQFDATIIGDEDGFKVLAVGGYLYKNRAQVLVSDQYNSGAGAKTVTLRVTDKQARQIVGALGALGGSQKATLMICPPSDTQPATNP